MCSLPLFSLWLDAVSDGGGQAWKGEGRRGMTYFPG